MTLLIKDPRWLYAYWEITPKRVGEVRGEMREGEGGDHELVIRTALREAGGAGRLVFFFDTSVHREARNWYLEIPADRAAGSSLGSHWSSELGYRARSGHFFRLLESNGVPAVASGPSSRPAPAERQYESEGRRTHRRRLSKGIARLADAARGEAARSDEASPGRAEGGPSRSVPGLDRRAWESPGSANEPESADSWGIPEIPGLRDLIPGSSGLAEIPGGAPVFPGASEAHVAPSSWPSSLGVSSFGGPPEQAKSDDFFFWVDCEVILHGGTQPDADVTVQGRRIQLREDGTFSFRYAFPNGRIDLPVRATRADGKVTRSAKPIVIRRTE